MAKLFASVVALAGIGGAVAMFTLKTTPHYRSSGFNFAGGISEVHPAWATAAGFGFLLGGFVLAAVVFALNRKRQ